MKVFVAGATGAIGRPVVRALRARGHAVAGLTRDPGKREFLRSLGAEAFVADALDAEGLARAVAQSRATHMVQLLTALPPEGPLRAHDLAATNALRTRGTENVIRAAVAAGVRRLVAESFMGVYGAADYDRPQDEDAPLADAPDRGPFRETVRSLRAHERLLREAWEAGRIETVVLRFGAFYGPEVASTVALARRLREGRMFARKAARGVVSFIHVEDAARAVAAALEHPAPGPLYNVVDDRPMLLTEAFREMAVAFGARAPRSLPLWLLRLVAPVPATAAQARLPLSNARARRELGWSPAFPTLADGLRDVREKLPGAA
jgi:nucleoside-diphosphate-sugar epimerase